MVYVIRRLYIENNCYGRFIFISCSVTELFPSKEMENVPELFPANRRYGESDGEMNGEISIHSAIIRAVSDMVIASLAGFFIMGKDGCRWSAASAAPDSTATVCW